LTFKNYSLSFRRFSYCKINSWYFGRCLFNLCSRISLI